MKTITLTDEQHKLLLDVVDRCLDEMGNSSCNDLPEGWKQLFNREGGAIAEEFARINNPSHPYGAPWPLPDYCLVAWLKSKLK